MFDLYSPTLVNAQEEYLQALGSGNQALVSASRERLLALGISPGQVDTLRKRGRAIQSIAVYAPQDGMVATLNAPEGMYVKPATEVLSLADLSTVWIHAEVFEQQADWVKVGQTAEVRLSFLPGRSWEGVVEYIYPSLDPRTRTLKLRLRFPNPAEELKPNMYADVTIYGGAKSEVLTIPTAALIRTGQDERVILAQGQGRFLPRSVVSGLESGEYVEILAGLEEGDKVVTSGQFLIDSEASLKASLQRMQAPAVIGEGVARSLSGTGVLRTLMPEQGKVSMQHDPIEALGWPSMVMDFDLVPGISLEGLNGGDAVEFELTEGPDGYRIKAIHRRDGVEASR